MLQCVAVRSPWRREPKRVSERERSKKDRSMYTPTPIPRHIQDMTQKLCRLPKLLCLFRQGALFCLKQKRAPCQKRHSNLCSCGTPSHWWFGALTSFSRALLHKRVNLFCNVCRALLHETPVVLGNLRTGGNLCEHDCVHTHNTHT